MVIVSNPEHFSASADAFVDLLGQISEDQWELPGLGSWTVRSLAGHTARAILTVESYLSQEEPGDVTIPSAEDYYVSVFQTFTDDAAVHGRGVEAGVWLAADPVGLVSAALARTRSAIAAQPPNRIVSIGGMGIVLDEYLRTRIFELVVHTIDLSAATGIPHTLPTEAMAETAVLAATVAARRGSAEQLLLALTGRALLPPGFSVV
jgi:uncharacterized protein (TIGR03083 family)